ncbi:hypothetical protein BH09ACT5_BH09ACT5_03170 [soil metagenome]
MSDIRPTPDAGSDPENPTVPEAPAHDDLDPETIVDELDEDPEVPAHHGEDEEPPEVELEAQP